MLLDDLLDAWLYLCMIIRLALICYQKTATLSSFAVRACDHVDIIDIEQMDCQLASRDRTLTVRMRGYLGG